MAAAARVMGVAGALYHANTRTSSFLLKPFSITHKAIRLNCNLNAAPRRLFACRAQYEPEYQIQVEGEPGTVDSRVSPWHDVPLSLGYETFHFIVEIPKESSAKMEVATDEPHTPIKQDTRRKTLFLSLPKQQLKVYKEETPPAPQLEQISCQEWRVYDINWNYGLLPQTWEDPSFANSEVGGAFGDNDPVDVVEIGERQGKTGNILKVKPLAALAMIDEGELDWKIVAISLDDPRASLLNDVDDVEKHFPGTLTAIRNWFRDYKIPDGKPPNKFGLGNKAANKRLAIATGFVSFASPALLMLDSVGKCFCHTAMNCAGLFSCMDKWIGTTVLIYTIQFDYALKVPAGDLSLV
ncbi:hypothetical protein AAG906_030111 [Vitis piasezkii]